MNIKNCADYFHDGPIAIDYNKNTIIILMLVADVGVKKLPLALEIVVSISNPGYGWIVLIARIGSGPRAGQS